MFLLNWYKIVKRKEFLNTTCAKVFGERVEKAPLIRISGASKNHLARDKSLYLLIIASVSSAIISSSFVGITITFTLESSVEIN